MKRALAPISIAVWAACAAPRAPTAGAPTSAGGREAGALGGSSEDAGFAPCADGAEDLTGCREECERGVASSCAILGGRLAEGRDAPHDPPGALRAYERGCDARDALSCVAAARMWAAGRGAPASRERQLGRLSQACELGDATSCMTAARAYAHGRGTERDETKARSLFERACGGGVEEGCAELGLDAGD